MNLKSKIKSFVTNLKRFREDHRKFKISDIRYYNFWALSKSVDCWFTKFIEHRNLNPNNKTINFFSVYGAPQVSYLTKSPKIFFTGENIFNSDYKTPYNSYHRNYIKNYNLSLGFNDETNEKYMRFPLWILYIIPADANYEAIKDLIDQYNNSDFRLNQKRKNFCANISRLDNIGIRKKIIENLNPIHQVMCAGSFMKNTKELQEKFNDNKIEYLKTFKFNICPENSNTKGYVTEKLFEAITSGTIPIYWGSNNNPEPAIINQEAILFFDENNPQELINQVNLLWNDEEAYQDFCRRKPFKDNAAEEIWKILNQLSHQLEKTI